MKKVDEKEFIEICQTSKTMAEAARRLKMHYNTFIRWAKKLNCYVPNQGGKGTKKASRPDRIKTQDILDGKYPDYNTYKLKRRLIQEGYKEDKCELCGWAQKRMPSDEFTPCELHHKDGNSHNHSLDNLIILCPNCHSLTNNYRAKNK